MPASLIAYWTAWNETDVDLIAGHIQSAVASDIEWNDPRDSFVGITELESAIPPPSGREGGNQCHHSQPPSSEPPGERAKQQEGCVLVTD